MINAPAQNFNNKTYIKNNTSHLGYLLENQLNISKKEFKVLGQTKRGDKAWDKNNINKMFNEEELKKITIKNIEEKNISILSNNKYISAAYLFTIDKGFSDLESLITDFIQESTKVDEETIAAFLGVAILEKRLNELGPFALSVYTTTGTKIKPGRREMIIFQKTSQEMIFDILNAVKFAIKSEKFVNNRDKIKNSEDSIDIRKVSGYLSVYNEDYKLYVQQWWEENHMFMWFERGIELDPDNNDTFYQPKALNALENISKKFDLSTKISAIADSIAIACYTAANAATEVLKELGDVPVYGQTQEGSIEMYKMRYDCLPFTPFSSAMSLLGDVPFDDNEYDNEASYYSPMIHPDKTLGSPGFKLLYSNRCLLAKKPVITYDTMPGVKALVDKYNILLPKRDHIDVDRYLQFTQNVSEVLRFVVDVRNYKSSFTNSRVLPIGTHVDDKKSSIMIHKYNGVDVDGLYYDKNESRMIMQLQGGSPSDPADPPINLRDPITDQELLSIFDNMVQSEEIDKIARVVAGNKNSAAQNRKQELINNLIDMNIIPINVHALMRDIPLANLYNYDYTFNQMVSAIYGKNSGTVLAKPPKDTQDMFVKLLADPYCDVTMDEYGIESNGADRDAFVARIFRGDNALGLGRPKFLADQLFNKCLFGSIYKDQTSDPDGGPIANIGSSRTDKQDHLIKVVKNLTDAMDNFIDEVSDLPVFTGAHNAPYKFNQPEDATHFVRNNGIGPNMNANAYRSVYNVFKTFKFNTLFKSVINSLSNINMDSMDQNNHKEMIITLLNRIIDILSNLSTTHTNNIMPVGNIIAIINGTNNQLIGFNAAFTLLTGDAAIAGNTTCQRLLLDFICHCSTTIRSAGANDDCQTTLRNVLHNFANKVNASATHGGTNYSTYEFLPSFNVSDTLSYMKHEDGKEFEIVTKQIAFKNKLNGISKLRFDTHFIRNLFFITNINRVVRQKLNRDLTQSRNVLVSSHDAVNPGITEYGFDPYSPNEVYSDKQWSDK